MDKGIQESMKNVYENNLWYGEESRSGRGSDPVNTQHVELELPHIINKLNVKSILDIPCGDFAWMPRMLKNVSEDVVYHGADIVEEIVENNKEYSDTNVSFSCLDITSDTLPYADLVLVRDCFNHLPNQKIFEGLSNIKKSNAKYIALTHFNWRSFKNEDIENRVGEKVNWRRINYTLDPFFFNSPIDFIVEGSSESGGKDKTLSVWKVSEINL